MIVPGDSGVEHSLSLGSRINLLTSTCIGDCPEVRKSEGMNETSWSRSAGGGVGWRGWGGGGAIAGGAQLWGISIRGEGSLWGTGLGAAGAIPPGIQMPFGWSTATLLTLNSGACGLGAMFSLDSSNGTPMDMVMVLSGYCVSDTLLGPLTVILELGVHMAGLGAEVPKFDIWNLLCGAKGDGDLLGDAIPGPRLVWDTLCVVLWVKVVSPICSLLVS